MRPSPGSLTPGRLLLVEPEGPGRAATLAALSSGLGKDWAFACAASAPEACRLLRESPHKAVVCDMSGLPGQMIDAGDSVRRIARAAGKAIVIAISKGSSVSAAVAAMEAGAHDFLPAPVDGALFAARLEELLVRHAKPGAVALTVGAAEEQSDFAAFTGTSPQMRALYEQIRRIAPVTAPVFIAGESGTGKELCARAIHQFSGRAARPLIAINCGAVPRDKMEAELFGVAAGADADRAGAVEAANGGTLFLDEIGELDSGLQLKLLRLLQTDSVTRIGEGIARPVDVRIICATGGNPMQMILDKRFREDLFYRLHVLPIRMPVLRGRETDIAALASRFLARFAAEEGKIFTGISAQAEMVLCQHDWPGNVRQLKNLMQRVALLADGGEIGPDLIALADIEAQAMHPAPSTRPRRELPILPMWQQEQQIIEDTIAHFGGNISQAAAALEISPSTIYRKRQSWEQLSGQAGAA